MVDRFVTVPDSLELPAAVKVPVARLSDAGTAGRAILDAETAADGRTALGVDAIYAKRNAGPRWSADKMGVAYDGTDQTAPMQALLNTVAAAGRAAFDAEHGAERRLAHGHHRIFAEAVERIGQADGDGGFALARRRGVDRRHQNQTALFGRQRKRLGWRDFGFEMAVRRNMRFIKAELGGNFTNGAHGGFVGDFCIGFVAHGVSVFRGRKSIIIAPTYCLSLRKGMAFALHQLTF